MKDTLFTVKQNKPLTDTVYEMVLEGDCSGMERPGTFVNLKIEGFYLRRPISVCDCYDDTLVLVYKVVGAGTRAMAQLEPGVEIPVLTALGNGYDLAAAGDKPLLIGGGVGVPPLYMLAKKLRAENKEVSVILGFNTKDEIFYEEEFKALGCNVSVTTVDGSAGIKGFVTNAFPGEYSYFYTCGPEPMLKAVYKATDSSGEFSFEERMGCGFGACMGCSCRVITGFKRICREGPVLRKEEILWEA